MSDSKKKNPLAEPIILTLKEPEEAQQITEMLQDEFPIVNCSEPNRVLRVGAGKPSFWKPKMFVVDMILPGFGAFDLVRKIADQFGSKKVPIVMISAYESKLDELEAYNAGATAFIVKPLTLEKVHSILEADEVKKLKGEVMQEVFDINYD
ncbi:MAG: response regulator [Bdellovibrionales bacterium]|nr:response regulator [Bdellovibrionales bacterium]